MLDNNIFLDRYMERLWFNLVEWKLLYFAGRAERNSGLRPIADLLAHSGPAANFA